jgi:hypothetical protein
MAMAGNLEILEIDNTAATEQIFVKFWDANHASIPTLGTTPPILSLPCPAGVRLSYNFIRNDPGSDHPTTLPYFQNGLWYNVSIYGGSTGTGSGGGSPDAPSVAPTLKMAYIRH